MLIDTSQLVWDLWERHARERPQEDAVINTAGHLVGPFEVESALLEIPEIKEAAVIGAPDETLFEKVAAFFTDKDSF